MPHFEYCSVVYSYALSAADLVLLNRGFHSMIRCVYGLRRWESVAPYIDHFLVCDLQGYFKLRPMTFLYNITGKRSPDYLYELLSYGPSERSRQLVVPNLSYKSCFYRWYVQWNHLPTEVRQSGSCNIFRRRCLAYV